MLNTPSMLVRAALGVLALTTVAAALQAPAEREMLVAVWDEAGQLLTDDLEIAATSESEPVKGILQSSGHFSLPGAGMPTSYGMKTTLELNHPFYGVHQLDLTLMASPTTTLDLAIGLDGELRAFGDAVIRLPQVEATSFAGLVATNDLCADALELAVGGSAFGTTVGATLDDVATCGTTITAPGVWYTVTGTGNEMTISTCSPNSNFDTKLSVFCGGCDSLNCIGGNDDNCDIDNLLSTVTFCSEAGATYYVLVHGFGENVGDFEVSASDGAPCESTSSCLATGACCVDGGCAILTQSACEDAGGEYQGDFSECDVFEGSRTFESGDVNKPIPDNDLNGTRDVIFVPNAFPLADVNLEVTVDHTFTGDLQVILLHNGAEVMAVDRPGVPLTQFGCGEDNWDGIVLDDEGTGGAVEDLCDLGGNSTSPPGYTPNSPLSAFDGISARGFWTIRVIDNADEDTGSLVSWKITLAKGSGGTVCDIR